MTYEFERNIKILKTVFVYILVGTFMEKYGFYGRNMPNIDCQLQITMLSKLLREEILSNPAYCPENLLWLKDGNKSLGHFHQVQHRK